MWALVSRRDSALQAALPGARPATSKRGPRKKITQLPKANLLWIRPLPVHLFERDRQLANPSASYRSPFRPSALITSASRGPWLLSNLASASIFGRTATRSITTAQIFSTRGQYVFRRRLHLWYSSLIGWSRPVDSSSGYRQPFRHDNQHSVVLVWT